MTIAAGPSSDAQHADMEPAVEEFDAVAAFEALLEDAPARKRKEPSEAEVEAPEEDVEEPSSDAEPDEETTEEAAEEGPEEDAEEADEATEADPEDAEVVVKVDGEERKVPLKDLKRLYGQEAALTRKSMEVAEARKATDAEKARAETALKKMLEKAEARLKPYAEVDWNLLAAQVSTGQIDKATYEQLRKDAIEAHTDAKFLKEELDVAVRANQEAQAAEIRKAAEHAVKVLSDPTTGIPNWGPQTYEDIVKYAVSTGVPEARVRAAVDPMLIKAFYKAMLYDRAQAAVKEKVKPIAQATAKRVLKPGKGGSATREDDALARLRKSGGTSEEAAVDAFSVLYPG